MDLVKKLTDWVLKIKILPRLIGEEVTDIPNPPDAVWLANAQVNALALRSSEEFEPQGENDHAEDAVFAADSTAQEGPNFEPAEHHASDEEQAARDQQYASFFFQAEEGDFTRGPARFVIANDGVQDCAALLLTWELSKRIEKTTKLQSLFSREERHAKKQIKEIKKFDAMLKREISSHKSKMRKAQGGAGDESNAQGLESELNILETMIKSFAAKKHEIEMNLQTRAGFLSEAQSGIMAFVNEACVAAALLEPDSGEEMPVETFDLQTEYQNYCAERQHVDGDLDSDMWPVPTLDTSRDYVEAPPPPLTAEDQAQAAFIEKVRLSRQRLEDAEARFCFQAYERDQEQYTNGEALAAGDTAMSVAATEFDLRWVLRNQEITHELIEAEQAVREANRLAAEAQVDVVLDTQSEYFVDRSIDGHCDSMEGVTEESIDRYTEHVRMKPFMVNWLSAIEDELPPSDTAADFVVDEWPSRDIGPGDSFSCVDVAVYRKHITEWQQACHGEESARCTAGERFGDLSSRFTKLGRSYSF